MARITLTITTAPFAGRPSEYVRRVSLMWLGRWWWVFATPLAGCLIGAAFEAVWLFVAMMLLFLLYPGITAMVYYNYAFSAEALQTLHNRQVTVTDQPQQLIVEDLDKDTRQVYDPSQIRSIEFGHKFVTVRYKTSRYGHIAIPLEAVATDNQAQFCEILQKLAPAMA